MLDFVALIVLMFILGGALMGLLSCIGFLFELLLAPFELVGFLFALWWDNRNGNNIRRNTKRRS